MGNSRTMRIVPWKDEEETFRGTLVVEWWENGKITKDERSQLLPGEFFGLMNSGIEAIKWIEDDGFKGISKKA